MTPAWETLLVLLALVLLGVGGFDWTWWATAADQQVNALVDEVQDHGSLLGSLQKMILPLRPDETAQAPSGDDATSLTHHRWPPTSWPSS